ncbi:MAG: ABC transporter permease [Paracoccaceae bacterium]
MTGYIIRRILWFIPTLLAVSIVSFAIIQLPPGDYLTVLEAQMGAEGDYSPEVVERLRERFGFDQPFIVQYGKWMWAMLVHGDMGYSFEWRVPVSSLIGEYLALTVAVTGATLIATWIIALPIGIYSAVRPHSLFDYVATIIGFIGKATPNFLLALILMWLAFDYWGTDVSGLFSPEYANAPWSWAKVGDLIAHMWLPLIVLGTSGAASLIRQMRANVLDELQKPYVEAARAQGLPEWRVILRYPVRVALNPFLSTIGTTIPELFSGAVTTAIVLNLPMAGPMLLRALISQDMYLAGSFIFMLSVFTLIGTLVSDILLTLVDPRIQFDEA